MTRFKLVKPSIIYLRGSFPHVLEVHCHYIIENLCGSGHPLVMIYAVLSNFDFVATFTVKI